MICRDCLQEVDSLTKKGICKKCYARKSNMTYLGKKYIPIKDLPKEEQERMLELREKKSKEGAIRKKKNAEKKSKNVESTTDNFQSLVNTIAKGNGTLYEEICKLLNIDEKKIREDVDTDIDKEFERRKVSLNKDSYIPLDEAFETLWCVCNEDNYLTEYPEAERILTDLVNDFQHQNEHTSSGDIREILIAGIRENQALNRRRPIKNVVDQMNCTNELRNYIKQDEHLMELISKTRIALKNEVKNQENPVYISKASELILGKENVLPEKRQIKQRYDVSVPCYNLFGNKNLDTFHLNGGALAYNEEGAKDILREILRTRFPNVTYKDKDIRVVPMEMTKKEGA